jgi:hypothetical protein
VSWLGGSPHNQTLEQDAIQQAEGWHGLVQGMVCSRLETYRERLGTIGGNELATGLA